MCSMLELTQKQENIHSIVHYMNMDTGSVVDPSDLRLELYLEYSCKREYHSANLLWEEITGIKVSDKIIYHQISERANYMRNNEVLCFYS